MNNDTCKPGFVPGPPAPNYMAGCNLTDNPLLKTYALPASVGSDAAGQPYAPKIGEFQNAIVIYEANSNIYIYDSLGTPTLFVKGDPNNVGGAITGPTVTQETGTSTTSVMSQKAVTDELNIVTANYTDVRNLVATLNTTVTALNDKVMQLQAEINAKELGVEA